MRRSQLFAGNMERGPRVAVVVYRFDGQRLLLAGTKPPPSGSHGGVSMASRSVDENREMQQLLTGLIFRPDHEPVLALAAMRRVLPEDG